MVNPSPKSSIVDSHCHLVQEYFPADQTEVIERAIESGVKYFVNPGVSLSKAHEVLELTNRYDQVYGGVGVHPHEASTWNDESEDKIRQMFSNQKMVAIGECGLDYFYNHSEPATQRSVFAAQVALATDLDKPLIVHCRDAWNECMDILEKHGRGKARGVFHCFTGGPELLPRIASLGFYISFSGIVTFKKSEMIQKAAQSVPSSKILVETDCPYLAPQKVRGQRNEPSYVWLIAEKLAELRNTSVERIAFDTSANAEELFRFPG
jgi:TatD DNase family protein